MACGRDDLRALWCVAVLFLANTLSFIDRTAFSLLLILVKPDVGLSDVQVGLLGGTAFSLLYMLACIPLSLMSETTVSRPRLLFGAVLMWSVMCSTSAAPWFATLFVARMGVGLGEAVVAPAAFSLISDLYGAKSAKVMGFYVSGSFVGTAVSYFLSAAATSGDGRIGMLASWQVIFLALGAAGAVFSLLLLTMKDIRTSKPPFVKLSTVLEEFSRKRSFYICFCVSICAYGLTMSSFAVFQLFFFREAAGYTDMWRVTIGLGVMEIVLGPGGALLIGVLSDYLRFSRNVIWAPGALMAGSMLVYVSLSISKTQLLGFAFELTAVTLCLEGMLYSICASVFQTTVAPNLRALSAGVLMTCLSVGILIGPALTGLLKEKLGIATALLIVNCAFGLPCACGFVVVAIQYFRIQKQQATALHSPLNINSEPETVGEEDISLSS